MLVEATYRCRSVPFLILLCEFRNGLLDPVSMLASHHHVWHAFDILLYRWAFRLQVNRDVPAITVLLSKEAVNTSHPG